MQRVNRETSQSGSVTVPGGNRPAVQSLASAEWWTETLPESRPALLFVFSIVAGLTVWELAGRLLSGALLAPPSLVLVRFAGGIADGSLPLAFASSIQHMTLGYLLAVAVATPLGIALGRSPSVATACEPIINAIYAIPPVAFVPFLIVWFGLYFEGRVALVFLMCFFEILINIQQGVRNVDDGLLEAAESLEVRGLRLYRAVVLPAAMPFIFTGLRVGIGRAVNAMITAELFFAAVNIGKMLKNSGNAFDTASMFGIILSVSLFGLVCQEAVRHAERRLLPWHHREAA
jgi:NitT/TauT family transport system permease protein